MEAGRWEFVHYGFCQLGEAAGLRPGSVCMQKSISDFRWEDAQWTWSRREYTNPLSGVGADEGKDPLRGGGISGVEGFGEGQELEEGVRAVEDTGTLLIKARERQKAPGKVWKCSALH